jgi:hypothetical protein
VQPSFPQQQFGAPYNPAAFFYPNSPRPSAFELPKATSYKTWRHTEVELGRFQQAMSAYAKANGLM